MRSKTTKRTYLLPAITLSLLLIPLISTATIQKTWENSTTGIHELNINFVLADLKDPNIIYAGTDKAVYKTVDNGKSWKWILTISGSEEEVNYIWIPPEKESYVYIATENGLYLSTNRGKGWELLYKGKSQDTRNCLCAATSGNTIYVGTKSGLLKSLDFGRTWHSEKGRLGDIEVTSIAVDPANSKIIFIASQEGVYRQQDNTNNWEKVYTIATAQLSEEDSESEETQTQEVNHITIDPKNSNSIFLATNNGIIFSNDAGTTWSKFNHEGLLTQNIRFLLIDPNNPIIHAATYRGIFVYTDNKWQELYKGMFSKDVRNMNLDAQGNLWVATDQGVFKTVSSEKQTPLDKLSKKLDIYSAVDSEPTIADIQKAVINYADVIRPERLNAQRRAITASALLPSTDFRLNVERDHWEGGGTGATAKGDDFLWQGVDAADWYITASWDFGNLIWNDEQRYVDNQARYMIELRDDLLDKVTRYYFERKRLKGELLASASDEEQELNDKELRLEELTAYIDALTGGYFSKEIENRSKSNQ